jgi:phage baseplate assembly protein gpV
MPEEIEIIEEGYYDQAPIAAAKESFARDNSYDKPLYITWGTIVPGSRNSSTMMVDVRLSTGMIIRNCEVASLEWVGFESERGYGERRLPSEKSKVLILFPDGIIENAIVICSVLSLLGGLGDKLKTELIKSGQEDIDLKIRKGGLKETYDRSTGVWTIEDKEGNKIILDPTNDITIQSKDNNIVQMNSDGITLTDKNSNTFVMGTSSIVINDNLEILQ